MFVYMYIGLCILFLTILIILASKVRKIPTYSGVALLIMYSLAVLGLFIELIASAQSQYNTAFLLYKIGFCYFILLLPMLTPIFLEYMYLGKINIYTIIAMSFTYGYGVAELSGDNFAVIGSPGNWQRVVQINHSLLLYFMLSTILSGVFATLIFIKGRKKFSSATSKLIIHMLGIFGIFAFISAFMLGYTLISLNEYPKIRYLIAGSQVLMFLILSILAIIKPGFYLMYPHRILYFMVYHRKSGILLYSKEFGEMKYPMELLSNFYSAMNETFSELEVGTISHIRTTQCFILVTEVDPISVIVCSKKYAPSLERALNVVANHIKRTIIEDKVLREQLESSIIRQEDWKNIIAPVVRHRLDMILP
ncbi:MAG: hypothetical protein ACTSVW_01135 [Candidatus Njordarchaeales archaeon]